MNRGIVFLTVCAVLFSSVFCLASAGGWAVVTLDAMPANLVVNEPFKIGMTIRQHGKMPYAYNNVRVRGFHSTGEKFETRAEMDVKGHYTATLIFSRAGKWQWAVASGLAPEWQTMADIEVKNSAQDEGLMIQAVSSQNTRPTTETTMAPTLLLALGVVGLCGSAGGLLFWFRARR